MAPLVAERRILRTLWQGTYAFFYAGLKGGTIVLFRILFRLPQGRPSEALPEGGVILCPNHQSYLDPVFVQLAVRRRLVFVMTNAFYSSRWARWFFRLMGALPVGSGRLTSTTMKRATALLRLGFVLVVFPEGRLSESGALNPAQRGVAVLARRGRAPIVPMAIEGSRNAWPKGRAWMRRAHVRVAVGTPVTCDSTGGRDDDQRFADSILARIEALKSALAPARP